jgi:hypothetical protein
VRRERSTLSHPVDRLSLRDREPPALTQKGPPALAPALFQKERETPSLSLAC